LPETGSRSIASPAERTPLSFSTRAGAASRVAEALLLDDDTVRNWHRAYEQGGVEGLKSLGHEGSSSHLADGQAIALADWVDANCPRSIRKTGAWLKRTFELSYSRSGLIALLHRLGFDYRKPEAMPRGLDDAKQQAFIDKYENLLNTMGADEAVEFVDAVHPTHQVRPAGCWARRDVAIAVEQTTGRERLNIHGAINLETGQTQILAVEKVNALSFIKLLGEIEGTHTAMRLIHVFVDNPALTRPTSSNGGLRRPGANSCCTSFRPIVPISTPSSACGP